MKEIYKDAFYEALDELKRGGTISPSLLNFLKNSQYGQFKKP